ncbi:putative transcription factor KAN2 [Platanthera zijinensis]|uniref:Transcription factor KAN2 n=1 Tax=Platanthera zijinensis TaxID=2320716 RepID=A0AAP0BIV9_9ASPA
MRWTPSLHARFARAVELLGGHERAKPKSVLELMHVKHLTLAHFRAFLQMYRTVKTAERGGAAGKLFILSLPHLCKKPSAGYRFLSYNKSYSFF